MDKSNFKLCDEYSTVDQNIAEVEFSEKFNLDNKRMTVFKSAKKKINMKDLLRFKASKPNLSKPNSVVQINRKRTNRNKTRNMTLNNIEHCVNVRSSDDECAMEKKVVLYSSKNKFMVYQDICAICGSVGIGKENCLISCAQCGQCYHVFCVNIKLSKVMLQKGWRCLDCTVCEGCGQKNDEARLILCDECDISYHIYCMSPPLDAVPNGNWKCKSCTVCQKCGVKSLNYKWINGNWECDNCVNKTVCIICSKLYNKFELSINCKTCNRWLHKTCQASVSSDETKMLGENEIDFNCVFCRLKIKPTPTLEENKIAKHNGKIVSNVTDYSLPFVNDFNGPTHIMDGVYVSHQGLSSIKTLTMEIKKKRKFRPTNEDHELPRAPNELIYNNKLDENCSTKILENKEDYKDGMVWVSSGNSPPHGFTIFTNNEGVNILKRKRQRNLQKVGIGGFNVKNRTMKTEESSTSTLFYGNKKKKPLRRKFKHKINESYPLYLREAFFGKTLLDSKSTYLEIPITEHNSSHELQSDDNFKLCLKDETESLKCVPDAQITLNHVQCKEFEDMPLVVVQQSHVSTVNKSETCTNESSVHNNFCLNTYNDQETLHPTLTTVSNEPIKQSIIDDVSVKPKETEKSTEVSSCGSQKTAEKMRIDEELGTMATISAVLYSNTQHPELKKIYPLWNDRCKQILKIWRSLSTEKKAPFLQQAKENRSTLRLRRTHQYTDGPALIQQLTKEQENQGSLSKDSNPKTREVCFKNDMETNLNDVTSAEAPSLFASNNFTEVDRMQFIGQFNIPEEQNSRHKVNHLKNVMKRNYNANVDDTQQLRNLLLKQGLPLIDENIKMENNYTSEFNSIHQNKIVTTFQKRFTHVLKKDCQIEQPINKNKCVKVRQDNNSEHEKTDSDENGAFGDILGGLDEGDDDDLIKSLTAEIGDDFNILEYADPELDALAENQILLNKLDFDDNDKKI